MRFSQSPQARFFRTLAATFKEAVKATIAAKSRALLSAVCIGIGIASVTVVVALGAAALDLTSKYMDMYGTDAVLIVSWKQQGNHELTLTMKDVEGLRANFPDAYLVAPQRFQPEQPVNFKGANLISEVDGVSTSLGEEWNWAIYQGRDFNEHDQTFGSNVCVIGDYIREVLFDQDNAIGQYIKVGRMACEVIGVAERRTLGGMENANTFVMIPDITFGKKFSWYKTRLWVIRMRFYDAAGIDRQMVNVEEYLRHTHNLAPDESNDFIMLTPSTMAALLFTTVGAIGAFLGVITLVIVVVGGFVTANMFLLATQSRIKEIGIRRAFGATARDIFRQFILEFIVIIFLGMAVGLAIGWGGARFISSYGIVEVAITPVVFGITAFISMLIALTFGILPARSAAKTNPIEAIRAM